MTTEKQSHPTPNPDSTLPKPPQPKSTTQSVMRLHQLAWINTTAMTQMNTTHRVTMMISVSKPNCAIHLNLENQMQKALNEQNESKKKSSK